MYLIVAELNIATSKFLFLILVKFWPIRIVAIYICAKVQRARTPSSFNLRKNVYINLPVVVATVVEVVVVSFGVEEVTVVVSMVVGSGVDTSIVVELTVYIKYAKQNRKG